MSFSSSHFPLQVSAFDPLLLVQLCLRAAVLWHLLFLFVCGPSLSGGAHWTSLTLLCFTGKDVRRGVISNGQVFCFACPQYSSYWLVWREKARRRSNFTSPRCIVSHLSRVRDGNANRGEHSMHRGHSYVFFNQNVCSLTYHFSRACQVICRFPFMQTM